MSFHDLYVRYHKQVQFLVIYIREAHPTDGWWFGEGIPRIILRMSKSKAATDVADPKTIAERRGVAKRCEKTLQYEIPTYVDELDDRVNHAYAARPTRQYLIGLDGRVVYAGRLGPFGLKPAELEAAIEKYLAREEVK